MTKIIQFDLSDCVNEIQYAKSLKDAYWYIFIQPVTSTNYHHHHHHLFENTGGHI